MLVSDSARRLCARERLRSLLLRLRRRGEEALHRAPHLVLTLGIRAAALSLARLRRPLLLRRLALAMDMLAPRCPLRRRRIALALHWLVLDWLTSTPGLRRLSCLLVGLLLIVRLLV